MEQQEEGQATEQPTVSEERESTHDSVLKFLDKQEAPETPPEEPKAEAPTEEAPAEEPAPEQTAEQKEAARLYKLKVKKEGGEDEEVEVDEDELKSGYMRQRDYQRKTAEVARERDAVREKVKVEVEPVKAQFEERLKLYEAALIKTLAPELESTDWNTLARENPAEWAAKMQSVNNVQNTLRAVQQEQAKLNAERTKEQEEVKARAVQESVETLQREIPGWSNDLYQSVLKAGVDFGFKQEEVAQVIDPRVIKMMHAAMKYQQLQNSKPQIEKQAAPVPKVLKPGTTEKSSQQDEVAKELRKKLKSTGRPEYAQALIERLL